jgi:hypothetical protein
MLDGDHPPNNNSTNGFNVTDLFSPLLAGDLSLANRIVDDEPADLAGRSDDEHDRVRRIEPCSMSCHGVISLFLLGSVDPRFEQPSSHST